ncbi:hypothetical protein Q5424_02890 [Conexibacter sp. JD483]|uniref:hypothetical protein n=1 Tax=unclassified Conexibacter TaxID=2627773 RepID=UPI00272554BC|nr:MULTISPECIES: hypothetical protein [unclassified Conexibacter]MDO8185052.1 hypothetical protein [Conexibacter sp. CPCC 205706]MDO8196762.1 hypothetical protein [Conexibacter sp. CPCC 205762]MDR9368010.1 hypothetical protein [Conexibacter sp. JD483]
MSPLLKLAAFAAGLAALFGVATLAGAAIDPERGDDAPAHTAQAESNADMAGHDSAAGADHGATGADAGALETERGAAGAHGGAAAADAVRGLATADGGLRLELLTPALERGAATRVRFRVVNDDDGGALRGDAYDVTHERKLHLIVVRRDLSGFHHLHPELAADGTWSAPLTLPAAGSYRLFADFSHDGEAQTLASDLRVSGAAQLRDLPAPATTATSTPAGDRVTLTGEAHDAAPGDGAHADGARVRAGVETTLAFAIERDGKAAEIEPYLGADGHLVALREGDLAFLHVHPSGTGPAFATTFPSAGRYRLFLQYKVDGRVETAAFTVEVGS